MADLLANLEKVPHEPGKPADAIDLSAKIIQGLAAIRANGRVPIALGLIVELPETPMGAEVGSACTIQVPFATAQADPGLLGTAARSATRGDPNG